MKKNIKQYVNSFKKYSMQKFDIIFLSVIIALTTGKPKSPQRGVAQVPTEGQL